MTDELVAFLRARLDERAAKADAARHGGEGRWHQDDAERYPGRIEDERGEPVVYDEGSPSEAQAAHIADNDPARVLRQTAVLRDRVDLWSRMVGSHARACLRVIAGIWDDHPDYKPKWKL